MTSAEIESAIRAISARIKLIDNDTPEMTGMDWASDHGWISQDEWEAAGEKSKAGAKLQDAEVEKIAALGRDYPQAMDEFLGGHIARLKAARDALQALSDEAKKDKLEFAMSFNLSLLPDIIAGLEAWRNKTKTRHWTAWLWRVAFSIGEESEAFVERANRTTGGKQNGR